MAVALSSFASAHTVGVRRSALLDEALFLFDLLENEFVVDTRPGRRAVRRVAEGDRDLYGWEEVEVNSSPPPLPLSCIVVVCLLGCVAL